MKIHSDEPDLTAYALDELTADDFHAAAALVNADPALRKEADDIAAIARALATRLAPPKESLLPDQRKKLLETAREFDRRGKILPFTAAAEGVQAWIIPAAAAAVLLIATTIFIRMSHQDSFTQQANQPAETVYRVAAGSPKPPAASPPRFFATLSQGPNLPAQMPVMELPVHRQPPGLREVASVVSSGKKPPMPTVRLGALLNSFTYRLKGTTAIARAANTWHPDTREDEVQLPTATLSTEVVACPWKPSACLVFVSIRGNAASESEIQLAYHTNPQQVMRYQLLGSHAGAEGDPPPGRLEPDGTVTLALEVESSNSATDVGTLEWSVNRQAAPAVRLEWHPETEPSDDARFAALACTYAQWLAGERKDLIDPELLSALARESQSPQLPAERAELIGLIAKSLRK